MGPTIVPLSLGRLPLLPRVVRRSVYWELDCEAVDTREFDPEFEKEAWLSQALLQWGTCGQLALLGADEATARPVGASLYAPPGMLPRAWKFPTALPSTDAVLLTTLYAEPDAADVDLREDLLAATVIDLGRRGARAIEAFGLRPDVEKIVLPADGAVDAVSRETAMIDATFLDQSRFALVAPHQRYPRYRLELDGDWQWQASVEAALDQLLQSALAEV